MKKHLDLKKRSSLIPAVAAMLLMAVGCGKGAELSSLKSNHVSSQEENSSDVQYRVTLTSRNSQLAPEARGSGTIEIQGDSITVSLQMEGVDPDIPHEQHIHSGTSCTGDVGQVIVPLDGDLNSPEAAPDTYPIAGTDRRYDYYETGSLSAIWGTLPSVELEGKVVEIHGVGTDQDLPIACGIIEKFQDEGNGGEMPPQGGANQQQNQQQQNQQQQNQQQQNQQQQNQQQQQQQQQDDNITKVELPREIPESVE